MQIQTIYIEKKPRGSIELPDTKDAKNIFFRTKQAYANHEQMSVKLVFLDSKLKKLQKYQKGGSSEELNNLDFYIQMGEILGFDTKDAQELKKSILLTNDSAHTNFNITKRIKLINKDKKSETKQSYLFWDIENFSVISSIFSDVIEPFEIEDNFIYLAANPDSLYLKKSRVGSKLI